MPSAVLECATTGRPLLRAVSTMEVSSAEREGRRGLAARAPAVVGVDLDPVRAVADLIADDADERVAVGFLRALRHAPLEREALRIVAAGRDDRARGDEHARDRE